MRADPACCPDREATARENACVRRRQPGVSTWTITYQNLARDPVGRIAEQEHSRIDNVRLLSRVL